MACVSMEGMLKKKTHSALLSIIDALRGLVSSLEALRDVETRLELEAAVEADHSGPYHINPDFLRLVAGTLKEMVEKLVSDITAKPEIHKLLMSQKTVSGAGNNHALVQDAAITNQPCNVVVTPSVEAVCIPSTDARKGK